MASWPDVEDLRLWLRSEHIHESSPEMVTASFDAARELIVDRVDATSLQRSASLAGVVIDPDDEAFDQAALDAYCPPAIRAAILIRAASIYVRRDSANGAISFGEFATSVRGRDPDVDDLLRPFWVPGIA